MQLSDAEIVSRLASIIGEALRIPVGRIERGSRLFIDLGAESLDILDIRFRMESDFGLQIDQEEIAESIAARGLTPEAIIEEFTVDAMVGFIREKLEAKSSATTATDLPQP